MPRSWWAGSGLPFGQILQTNLAGKRPPDTVQARSSAKVEHTPGTRSLPQCGAAAGTCSTVDVGAGGLREAAARGRSSASVAAAALGIEHAQSQARLAGAGDPGDAYKLAKWARIRQRS